MSKLRIGMATRQCKQREMGFPKPQRAVHADTYLELFWQESAFLFWKYTPARRFANVFVIYVSNVVPGYLRRERRVLRQQTTSPYFGNRRAAVVTTALAETRVSKFCVSRLWIADRCRSGFDYQHRHPFRYRAPRSVDVIIWQLLVWLHALFTYYKNYCYQEMRIVQFMINFCDYNVHLRYKYTILKSLAIFVGS